jgi:PAS domain S-box-containing protein
LDDFLFSKKIKKDASLIQLFEGISRHLSNEIRRRNSEEQLKYIFNFNRDLFGIVNTSGEFVQVNEGFKDSLAYEESMLLEKSFYDYVHVQDRDLTRNIMDDLEERDITSPFEIRCLTSNHDIRWISWSATKLPGEDLIFLLGRDITNIKKHQVEREALIEQLTASNEDLKQFSYIVSHNLRAPLSNLMAVVNFLTLK